MAASALAAWLFATAAAALAAPIHVPIQVDEAPSDNALLGAVEAGVLSPASDGHAATAQAPPSSSSAGAGAAASGDGARSSSWCQRADGVPCSSSELEGPDRPPRVLVLPAGFGEGSYAEFRAAFRRFVAAVSTGVGDEVFSARFRSRLLYVGRWQPVGLAARAAELAAVAEEDDPLAVVVLYAAPEDGMTPSSVPPSATGRRFGIVRLAGPHVDRQYHAVRGLARAALNLLDEGAAEGLEEVDVASLDALAPSPRARWWPEESAHAARYSMRLSEVVAANGHGNVDVTRFASRVETPGHEPVVLEREGGALFGRGAWHGAGPNIMGSDRDRDRKGGGDGFAYAHSPAQRQALEGALGAPPSRPNDRIRNAGPHGAWEKSFGDTAWLLLFDADKRNRFHPTKSYEVELGWFERRWKLCWMGAIPYPCHERAWTAFRRVVQAETREVALPPSGLWALGNLFQRVGCGLAKEDSALCGPGAGPESGEGPVVFEAPYQEVEVPLAQPFTTYYWRFSASNGRVTSGKTGWAEFTRGF